MRYLYLVLTVFLLMAGGAFASGDSDSEPDPKGACCYEKTTPQGPRWDCGNNKTEEWCQARDSSTWSEGLDCSEVSCPPIELGSCCIDCLPESGDSDLCEEEATEAYCDEAGGSWLLDTPCSQREDCGDECPIPRVEGAICDPDIELEPGEGGEGLLKLCEDQITFEECQEFFSNCEEDWKEGETCKTIACEIPQVPTMPAWVIGFLAASLVGGSYLIAKRSLSR